MSSRTYGDSCGIARGLDILGDRWTLLVLRELLLGPKRFSDLETGLGRIGPDVLAQRLRDLESSGLVRRATLDVPGRTRVYELTERGHEAEPVLHALGRFGATTALPDAAPALGVDGAAVALRTMFDPARAGALHAVYELRLADDVFCVSVADGELTLERGVPRRADVVITTTPGPLAALLWHGRSLADAIDTGEVSVRGNRRTAARFCRLFPLHGTA